MRLLHVLPHEGGGGEAVVDALSGLPEFEHERVHLSTGRDPLRSLPSIARGAGRVRRLAARADAVHVIGDAATVIVSGTVVRRPALVGTHGLHLLRRAGGPAGALVHRRLRAAVRGAELTACSSTDERDELLALAGPEVAGRLRLIPNGVTIPPPPDAGERAAVRAELGLEAGDVVALYLGQLEPRKRPLEAVAAAERAAATGAPLVLLVAGEGPLAEEVRSHAGPEVHALGFRRDPERLLAAADILVMPSEREGLSLAVLEAMAAGLAPVVSDGPGNPEAVGEAGVVVPVGDVSALASALERLAGDPEERTRLGAAARARAEAEFSIERFLADMRRAFLEVLGQPEA